MSFWNEDNYKMKLVHFTERFIPHNTSVRLYTHKRVTNDQGMRVNQFDLIWKGMSWQIIDGARTISDYSTLHREVCPCPYSEANVVSITSAGITGISTDEISLIIEED